ncbi:hypothetical protein ZIOFF_014211 [Zingiber officinale]|uniref:dUTP diphosphatase n=1 Tax=Zingiber officinale TaxID=94328 RepID=A0A8J5HAE3_ZINOF|nr:hypothetical protein ZIOFF_014211 [Zingiber officinale]
MPSQRRFRRTIETQLSPEAQLEISITQRARMVPAKILYSTGYRPAQHQVYQHYSEEGILCVENNQVDLPLVTEQSHQTLREASFQHIHIGLIMEIVAYLSIEEPPVLKVKKLHPAAVIPQRQTEEAAGYDLKLIQSYEIFPGDRALLSTGILVAIPDGHYGRIAAKSGAAFKQGIHVGVGVIDLDYRGEIKILVFNLNYDTILLVKGEAIAQLIIEKISTPQVLEVDDLIDTTQGSSGFGSTSLVESIPAQEKDEVVISEDMSDFQDRELISEPNNNLRKMQHGKQVQEESIFDILIPKQVLQEEEYWSVTLHKDNPSSSISQTREYYDAPLRKLLQGIITIEEFHKERECNKLIHENLYMIHDNDGDEWINPFAKGSGNYTSCTSSSSTSTSDEGYYSAEEDLYEYVATLDDELELDYPVQKPTIESLLASTSAISQYNPPPDSIMGPPQYAPTTIKREEPNVYNDPNYYGARIGKLQKIYNHENWVLPSAQQQTGAMLVLPANIGLYHDVISKWESITTNVVDSKIWADNRTKVHQTKIQAF